MKKSTQQDIEYTDTYVQLLKTGLHPVDARKQAEKEIYGMQIPEPRLKSTDLADLQALEQERE